jgi:hypothetical protein
VGICRFILRRLVILLHKHQILVDFEVQGPENSESSSGHWCPLTDGCHGFSLVIDLFTEEVPLAHDEDEEYCSTVYGSLHDIKYPPDVLVDSRHGLLSGTIGTLNWSSGIYTSISEARPPIDFQDLIPHRYER